MKYGDKKEDNGRAIAVDAKTQFYMDHDPNFMMYVSLFLDKPSGVRVVGTLDNATEFIPSITEDKPKRRQ